MLYFHLNMTNFIDPMINGEENNIGIIETFFFNEVFSSLSDAKAYTGSWSEDPPFTDVAVLKGKKWLLTSVDDESVKATIDDILALMEKAHSIKIPHIGKSLNDMRLHYDFVINISNKKANLAWMDYMAENNLQYIEESVGNRNMTLSEKIDFLSTELLNIKSKGNQLTIVDPYIFPEKHDADYEDLFLGVIKKAEVSSVKVITDLSKYETNIRQTIEAKMPVPMTVYNSRNLHDRWWIIESEKTVIICGSSLNGIGKGKLATITPLPKSDAEKIINDISTISKKIL